MVSPRNRSSDISLPGLTRVTASSRAVGDDFASTVISILPLPPSFMAGAPDAA
jgi:hypothetical protein